MTAAETTEIGRPSTRFAFLSRVPVPELLIFTVALVARVARNVVGGGFAEPNGYDPGVYYAAAAGLAHGKLPYRDFTMVHPPGIAIVEAPFALLGRVTTDLTGYVAATIALVVMASVSAVLVTRVAGAMGLPRRAALIGGLVYALWSNAVAFEFVGRLELVGNFFLLCGLLAFYRAIEAAPKASAQLWVLSGLAFGAAVSTKLWWIFPIAAFLGWQFAAERRLRRAWTVLLGGVIALVVINGPFFLLSGQKMWDMIVIDQLDRPANDADHLQIFSYLVAGRWTTDKSTAVLTAIVIGGAILLAFACWRAWQIRPARAVIAILLAQCVQIWFQPVWFPFYANFVTVGLCLLIAAVFARPPDARTSEPKPWLRRNWLPATVLVVLAANTTYLLASWEPSPDASPAPFPRAQLRAAIADARCVMTDQPMGQIQLDVLGRSFDNNCRNWVDFVGRRMRFNRTFGPPSTPGATLAWNQLFASYLESGDVLILTRSPEVLGLTPAFMERLRRGGVLVEVGGYTIYRTPH